MAPDNFAVLRLADGSVAVLYPDRTLIVAPDGQVVERPRYADETQPLVSSASEPRSAVAATPPRGGP